MDIKSDKRPYKNRKVNKDKIDLILQDIAEGSTHYHAAFANGISDRHFYYMLNQGVWDMENGEDTLYSYLVQGLRTHEQNEIKACKNDITINDKGHKGKQWVLEHYYWEHFGPHANLKELARKLKELEQMEQLTEED